MRVSKRHVRIKPFLLEQCVGSELRAIPRCFLSASHYHGGNANGCLDKAQSERGHRGLAAVFDLLIPSARQVPRTVFFKLGRGIGSEAKVHKREAHAFKRRGRNAECCKLSLGAFVPRDTQRFMIRPASRLLSSKRDEGGGCA